MGTVEFRDVKKSYGSNVILPGLDLSIREGEFVALVGPSGCGKSTILRMLAGLDDPTEGTILIDGKAVNDVSPNQRGVSMVFQSYALYPHMTVAQNLAFPLKMAKLDPDESEARIRDVAVMLDLGSLLERKPSQLSGGQKQRVAMGRAMVRRPKVLLFDEPLSNLDAQLRVKVRAEIAHLHQKIKATVVYVTHDQVEAMTLAHRIAVLNRGNLEQFGTPLEVYREPKTKFVASFIGTPPMNFLALNSLPVDGVSRAQFPYGTKTLGFRPSKAGFKPGPQSLHLGRGRVNLVESLGGSSHVHVGLENGTVLIEAADGDRRGEAGGEIPRLDQSVDVCVDRASLFFFDSSDRTIQADNPSAKGPTA